MQDELKYAEITRNDEGEFTMSGGNIAWVSVGEYSFRFYLDKETTEVAIYILGKEDEEEVDHLSLPTDSGLL